MSGASVEREVRSVMGTLPRSVYSVASRSLSSSTQIPRRPKQKTKLQLAEEKYARQGKKPKLVAKPDPTFQKKLVVFKYMGQDAPAHFTRKDKYILMHGILPDIPLNATESQVRQEICEVIQTCSDHDLGFCGPSDFEFIDMSGKHASVPNHKPGFVFTASAVKKLVGGDFVYVRLTRKFAMSSSSDSDSCGLPHVDLQSSNHDVTFVKVEHPPPVATPSSRPSTSQPVATPSSRPSTSQPVATPSSRTTTSQPVTTPSSRPSTSQPVTTPSSRPSTSQNESVSCHRLKSDMSHSSSFQCQSVRLLSDSDNESDSMQPENTLEQLLGLFESKLSKKQVCTVFDLSNSDFDNAMECLLEGPTVQGLIRLHQKKFNGKPASKFFIDSDDLWSDMVGYYKSGVNVEKPVRVILDEQPAIDTGGVRRQVFSDVFALFATNKHFRLFEGQPCSVWPVHSADVRSSGMLKVFGTMIAHSVAMDGVGFPYLSPLSYWYITAGETEALQHMGPSDVGADVADVIAQVCVTIC